MIPLKNYCWIFGNDFVKTKLLSCHMFKRISFFNKVELDKFVSQNMNYVSNVHFISDVEILEYLRSEYDSFIATLKSFQEVFKSANDFHQLEQEESSTIESFEYKLAKRILVKKQLESDFDKLFAQYYIEACNRNLISFPEHLICNLELLKSNYESCVFIQEQIGNDSMICCFGNYDTFSLIELFSIRSCEDIFDRLIDNINICNI